MLPSETLAANVRALMASRSWVQTDLAKASGVAQRTVSNILMGKHGTRLDVVDSIAKAFGLTAADLLDERLPNVRGVA